MTMKRLFGINILMILILIGFAPELKAQSNWEAGVRFGDEFALDLTIPLAASPRLHPAIYFDRFGIGTYFDWRPGLEK